MAAPPDLSNYSIPDLQEALATIDGRTHPENKAALERQLQARKDSGEFDRFMKESQQADKEQHARKVDFAKSMRKLQRGGYSVQAEIDLHGMTLEEAKPALSDFINYSASQGKYCVRVVHGKGLGSGHRGPVLKNAVNRWLRKWDCVLAFVSTRQVDGGTGAVYVLLQDV